MLPVIVTKAYFKRDKRKVVTESFRPPYRQRHVDDRPCEERNAGPVDGVAGGHANSFNWVLTPRVGTAHRLPESYTHGNRPTYRRSLVVGTRHRIVNEHRRASHANGDPPGD